MERARGVAGAHRNHHGGVCHHEIRAGDHSAPEYAHRGSGLRGRRFCRDGDRGRVWGFLKQVRADQRWAGHHSDGRRQMNMSQAVDKIPNGPGAAAILAAGIGCAVVGILAFAAEASKPLASWLNFYNPTGPLSGKTTVAVIVWLVAWFVLSCLLRGENGGP